MAMMSSVPIAPPPTVRVLPTMLAALVASLLFVVGLSVVARLTAEGAVMPPPPALLDDVDAGTPADGDGAGAVVVDGVDAGVVDEVVDAGVLVTVEGGPDAGPEPLTPPTVDGPPYDVRAVAAAAAALVADCSKDALRWDPSLGGPFTLRVTLPAADVVDQSPVIVVDGLRSPVLQGCLQRRQRTLDLPAGATGLLVSQVVTARAALGTDGSVSVSDETVMAP